jgi:two-component system sensor histidine kinase and response regulator WspE
VFGCHSNSATSDELSVVVLGERLSRSGLVVDKFIGERSLVVHTLDPRLGKVQDISAASVLENGDPCLIIDVDDMLRSIDILIAGGRLDRIKDNETSTMHAGKRILVVDDSITVREVERNMLATRGYQVDVAVDGMDGWNAVRMSDYDLIISDVDMPRMNGFEFVRLIKQDDRLHGTPVMIVSYKDREEDRQRGLEAGADYYLTKGSFHDETLIDAVVDLIGTAE